jgi:hypothetical protein
MDRPVVYDKGKYHDETVQGFALPEEQASVHTAFFLGWLMERDLIDDEFAEDFGEPIASYLNRTITAVAAYEAWDRCLLSDMLSDEGNAFAQAYFDFENGQYLADYGELLVKELPSEFHVKYSWENQQLMNSRIDARYAAWKKSSAACSE